MTEVINIAALMQQSNVKFGTSGARGLVCDMTDRICYSYTLAFVQAMLQSQQIQIGDKVMIAGDYRNSTPRIMAAAGKAVVDAGLQAVNCGMIPTPALALYAMAQGSAGLMVTGSHIPDDRNGIKFYKPQGEILKEDEQVMCAADILLDESLFDAAGMLITEFSLPKVEDDARALYVQRYLNCFAPDALQGMRIGVYEHSSVARDLMVEILQALGGDVVRLGRSEHFIPVDTEAIRDEDVKLAAQWSRQKKLDCLVSTDGDGDRPLISDEHGVWLRGDVAGVLCAQALAAEHVVTPVSSNSAVEKCGWFTSVQRTRIGSPFVIATMQDLLAKGCQNIVGYEANGGFLTATDIQLNGQQFTALPTRDAVIVCVALMVQANEQNKAISALLQALPQRFTYSNRLKNFPSELSQAQLAMFNTGNMHKNIQAAEAMFKTHFGAVKDMDFTDGVRITFANDDVAHLRASGNAPELRCYNESATAESVQHMNAQCMDLLRNWQ